MLFVVMRKCYTTFALSLAMAAGVSAQVVTPEPSGPVNTGLASATGKVQTKIRAVAVVEFAGDQPTSGKYRLVPISIFTGGSYHDGESYLANPVPFALQDQVIYEVQSAGKPLGYATVDRAGQSSAGPWYGIGLLQKSAPDAMAKAAPAKITVAASNSEEHRVYMPDEKKDKRRGRKDKQTEKTKPDAQPTATSKPETKPDADRPTLKKRPPEAGDNQEKIDQASATNGQPVLPPEAVNDDPNRPRLTRGKPANTPGAKPDPVNLTGDLNVLVAVSDPDNKEPHPYRFDFSPREEQTYRDKMIALAASEARRTRPDVALPAVEAWKDLSVRAYNLSLDNVATLVLTATIPATEPPRHSAAQGPSLRPQPAAERYLTLVARVDIEGEARRTFFQLTDKGRFDVAPRMTLVDAVDADGDGRGELLFRLQSDQGLGWGIYRAGPDELSKLFDTFPAEN